MNLKALIAHLDQDFDLIANTALAFSAARLADDVRTAFSTPPGGPHEHPWLRSGCLRESIEAASDGPSAVVASRSETALYQEHGTATVPPRPTLAPIAAAEGAAIADSIAHTLIAAIGPR